MGRFSDAGRVHARRTILSTAAAGRSQQILSGINTNTATPGCSEPTNACRQTDLGQSARGGPRGLRCRPDSAADDLETANALVEQWIAGWNNDDSDAMVALFTQHSKLTWDVGVWSIETDTGRDEIREFPVDWIADMTMTGDLTLTDVGVFTCRGKWDGHGTSYVGEVTLKLFAGYVGWPLGPLASARSDRFPGIRRLAHAVSPTQIWALSPASAPRR